MDYHLNHWHHKRAKHEIKYHCNRPQYMTLWLRNNLARFASVQTTNYSITSIITLYSTKFIFRSNQFWSELRGQRHDCLQTPVRTLSADKDADTDTKKNEKLQTCLQTQTNRRHACPHNSGRTSGLLKSVPMKYVKNVSLDLVRFDCWWNIVWLAVFSLIFS